ncbi:MAG: N-acetylglucosamine-6-phosphate deacetylase [Candidatus Latescibacterota bacterium]|jgi:N-acetylglucosamine-6-phosphate deacetylase
MTALYISGCRLLNPGGEPSPPTVVAVDQGRIAAVGGAVPPGAERIDAAGRFLVPGFIDVHVQGAGGAIVMEGTPQALRTVSATQARYGVTGYLATTVYRPGGDNDHLDAIAAGLADPAPGAACLGIHLEGPFIAPARKGMIRSTCIGPPDPGVMVDIRRRCGAALRMMTIAPELPGSLAVISALAAGGSVAAFGHSAADYDQTRDGIASGITHVTHLFNAMTSIHHRQPGPALALFEAAQVTAQVISDGVHLHPAMVRLVRRLIGDGRIALITDGMQAMGLPDGDYEYDGVAYTARDGAARYCDGTLIGTACGFTRILGTYMRLTGASLAEALVPAVSVPARVLGLEQRKGKVQVGMDADLVVLGADLEVYATLVEGRVVYRRTGR